MREIFLLLSLLLFIGCGGSPEPLTYPQWYLNTPQGNGDTLYGAGEGKTIQDAKTSALNSVASSLSVTVSSELQKSESSSSFNGNEQSYRLVVNRVKAEVKKITFGEYRVRKSQQLGERFIVLVEVSRQALFNEQKARLERLMQKLKAQEESLLKLGKLQQAYGYKTLIKEQEALRSLALLVHAVNKNFQTKPAFDYAQNLQTAYEQSLARLSVTIRTQAHTQIFYKALKEGFNAANIATLEKGGIIQLKVQGDFQTDTIYGFKFAKAALTLSTQENGKNIATRNLNISGKSRYDYDKAKQNAAQKLRHLIKKEGIFSLLGLH